MGIVTVYNACNYGSFLQAYALQQFLGENGYDVSFICIPVDYDKIVCVNEKSSACSQYEREKYKRLMEDQKVFGIVEHIDSSYCCCIIGSDTVWNVFDHNYANISYFYGLDLECKNIISYAASVGQSKLSKIILLKGKKLLPIRKFTHIGVRDDNTERLIKMLGGKPVRVLDPTFLYVFQPVKPDLELPEKYLFAYTYSFSSVQIDAILSYAKKNGLKIIATGSLCNWADINPIVNSFEWLWLIQHASAVVTGTFHGSVFSIIYHKNFAVLSENSAKVYSLLKEFGLLGRIGGADKLEEILDDRTTYCDIEKVVQQKIVRSKDYLLSSVENGSTYNSGN